MTAYDACSIVILMTNKTVNKEKDTRTRILEANWHLMEKNHGLGVSMSKIAKEAGISRQALYLHFDSRIELMIATVNYVDDIKGLNERLKGFQVATTGVELLEACVEIWGNYIPEIYGLAKAMLNARETDEAAATAWKGCTVSLHEVCGKTIDTLDDEGKLLPNWSRKTATEMFMTLISIYNWEQLTIESGWSNEQYVERMKIVIKATFVAH